jgi:hypothetical protein
VIPGASGWQPEALTLGSFDLLSPETNLTQVRTLLQAQLGLAAHNPAQPERILTQPDGQLDPAAQWAHVHQFVHTLQVQHHSLDFAALNALDFDARLAFYGLVEGEAALVEALYLEQGYLSGEEAAQITGGANQAEADVLQALPAYLVNEYAFPSSAGEAFATALYGQGQESFAQIDAAWQDPPTSTEQILHPDRFLAGDAPRSVTLPLLADALGTGWSLVDEGRLGEFFLRQYLAQQLNETQVETAATGWGGDHFALYQNEAGNQVVMVLRLLWDTVEDGGEFAAIYPNYPTRLYNISGELLSYGAECWQGDDVICLYRTADETFIWRSPDIDTAAIIAQELELGQEG